MGKIVIEKWQCDRCECLLDKQPTATGLTLYTIQVGAQEEWYAGKRIDWRELCANCNLYVGQEVKAMEAAAEAARQRVKEGGHA